MTGEQMLEALALIGHMAVILERGDLDERARAIVQQDMAELIEHVWRQRSPVVGEAA